MNRIPIKAILFCALVLLTSMYCTKPQSKGKQEITCIADSSDDSEMLLSISHDSMFVLIYLHDTGWVDKELGGDSIVFTIEPFNKKIVMLQTPLPIRRREFVFMEKERVPVFITQYIYCYGFITDRHRDTL
ncbi:MAG: hypothetical protein JWQ09_945 [Segetibacter sp.]|nr:hypothetical protein [Segetibacter sp.]